MKAALFDNLMVEIDAHTAEIGKVYERKGNVFAAEAQAALRWVYNHAKPMAHCGFLDIGAHTGTFSLLAAHHPGMTVYAFEPCARAYGYLQEAIDKNGLSGRVSCERMALSNSVGAATLKIPQRKTHWSLATLGTPKRFNDVDTETVPVNTLDIWAEERGPDRIDIIKIDTEGAELDILRGGEQTIRQHKPLMILEYEGLNTAQFGYRPEAIRELLESWGAQCRLLPPRDLVVEGWA